MIIMFTSIKNLTALIDKNIGYVLDAKNNHECSQVEYESYLESMEYLLDKQIKRLSELSCNKKLIESYRKKIFDLFS